MKFILTKKFCVYVDFIEKNDEFIPGYVGKGTQVRVNGKERNKQHRNYAKKYEWKRVVGYETDNEGEAFEVEMLLVRELHTYVHDPEKTRYACNQTLGGEGLLGHIHSKETREKVSKAHKGRKHTLQSRLHMSEAHRGSIQTEEQKRKNSITHKGKQFSKEHCEKLSHVRKDWMNNSDFRLKERLSILGKKSSKETCKKISQIGYESQNRPNVIKQKSSTMKTALRLRKMAKRICTILSVDFTITVSASHRNGNKNGNNTRHPL